MGDVMKDLVDRLKYHRANGWKCHGQMVGLMDEAIEQLVQYQKMLINNEQGGIMEWEDGKPTRLGWYAILYCWDDEEGPFTGSSYWDGGWSEQLPIIGWIGPFKNEDDAEKEAESRDI